MGWFSDRLGGGLTLLIHLIVENLKNLLLGKRFEESKKGKLCVMLLPVSTSTKIFHEIIYPNAEIRFIKGRVKFEGINTFGELVKNKCGMHDSMLVIFKPKGNKDEDS